MLHIYLILAPHLLNSMSIPNSDSDSNDNNSGGSHNNDDKVYDSPKKGIRKAAQTVDTTSAVLRRMKHR